MEMQKPEASHGDRYKTNPGVDDMTRLFKRLPLLVVAWTWMAGGAAEPIDIGSRLELMADEYLVESRQDVELRLHRPTPREIAIVHNEPWEGNASGGRLPDLESVEVPNELSIYVSEGAWLNDMNSMRRYTLRIDGFVSMHAPLRGGGFVTKPIQFTGKRLVINYATSAAGSVRVELQNAGGTPIEGYSLDDCPEIYGDTIDQTVHWKPGSDVSGLAGKTVRLRFVLKDADLYSLQFR